MTHITYMTHMTSITHMTYRTTLFSFIRRDRLSKFVPEASVLPVNIVVLNY